MEAATALRKLIAVYREHEDLISIGAYRSGSNPVVDAAIAMKPDIDRFLQQGMRESTDMETTIRELRQLAEQCCQHTSKLHEKNNIAANGENPQQPATSASG